MPDIDYKKMCQHYEKLLGINNYDPVKTAFVVYIKMLNQQVTFLNTFDIKSHISNADKESPEYKRAIEMVDNLPKMITAVDDLRKTLKLTKEDIYNIEGVKVLYDKVITPESVSDVLSNPGG